ncbi:conserved hypothetical protein [Nitrosococcus halophilus Nc 4]|uniref:Uncharacterized protein n=1 Tax=Nitrosococcus halophilus (strain Nc4) TaxID=472759 RepID=D5BZX6_NITHN|nr:hypothetical protein [Nitrosococcus halophilus]ADE16223.1 conserved hypothetical protein [Nitrosococcus halophilus Nc 4]
MEFIKYFGPMRIVLALFTFTLIGMAPFASEASFSGWGAVVGTVAPSLTVIMLFVLPLDMMMSRIFMTDTEGAQRLRYRRILWLEFFLFIALLLAWGPFIANLLRQL